MFPSPLRIFNQPETRTAFPSLPPSISIRQPNPINFPSPNKHVLSRCTGKRRRRPRKSAAISIHASTSAFCKSYACEIFRGCVTQVIQSLPPSSSSLAARGTGGRRWWGREPLFPAGVEKAQGRRGAIESRWTYSPSLHPPPPSKLPSATPSPAAILIGEPPTSRISPLPPPTYQRRSAALPRLFAVPFASTPFGDHPDFDGIRGSDLDKFFLLKFFPSPRKVLKLIEFSSSFLRWGIRVQYHWFLLVFFLKCFEKFNTSKWFFSNISFVEY